MAAVEEFELAEAQVRPTTKRARRRRALAVPWLVAAAAMVTVGVVAAPPGGIPLGSLPQDKVAMIGVDARRSPTEQWRTDVSGWHGEARQIAVLGDTVVAITGDVHGIDLTTGDVRWRAEVSTYSCTVHDAVACVVGGGTARAVVVRIEADGSSVRIPVPAAVRAVDVGPDVVVLAAGAPDQRVRRVSPDGSVVWAAALPDDLPSLASDMAWVSMAALGDRLHLGVGTVVTLDVADGSLVDERIESVNPTGYGYLIVRGAGQGAYPDITLVDRDGDVLIEDIVPIPDDDPGSAVEIGYAAGTLVTRGEEVLWQHEDAYPVARVAGVAVLMRWRPGGGDPILTGHDVLTGEVLWEQSRSGTVLGAGGRALLLWDVTEGGLHGVDLGTGEELWSFSEDQPLPSYLLVPGGILLLDGTDLVHLSW